MKWKIVSGSLLTLLLVSSFSVFFNVGVAPSKGAMANSAEGSLGPSTASAPTRGDQSFSTLSMPPPTQWNKTYGGAFQDRAYSVIQTNDGGYAIVGLTNSYGAGGADFWLIKTDSTGNTQWSQTYGRPWDDAASSVVQTSDGGYALAGYTVSFGAGDWDFWLVKTDSAGDMQWNKTYGGSGDDWAWSMVETNDGGYALAGYTTSYGAGSSNFFLVKTDSAGNMQWNQTYGGMREDVAYSVVQTSDGGYALAGTTNSPPVGLGYVNIWFVKTDSVGNMEWNRLYHGISYSSYEECYSLVQTSDGGYALAGYTKMYGAGGADFWLVKTDPAGNIQWNNTFGGTGDEVARSVIQTSDGGYALAGYTWPGWPSGADDFFLAKTDSAGNLEWNGTYGGVYWEEALSLIQTSDGGYALAGIVSYAPELYDFWLVKVGVAQSAVDEWPMFHHDLTHTGYSTSTAPNTSQLLWSYQTGDIVDSSPAVVGGRVYIGSRDRKVYALNATTGAFIWSYTTGDIVYSSPAVADGVVYVGSSDSKVYALNATTGDLIWSYRTGNAVASSPAVADGKVYIASYDNNVYALNATTGALIWSHTPGNADFSSPAVAYGMVFVGSWTSNIYGLNATTGDLVWSYRTGDGYEDSSPTVAYGMVYEGSNDFRVHALNATTGAGIWIFSLSGGRVRSTPAVADGIVIVGSDDYHVYAMNATTGVLKWNTRLGEQVISSPAIVDGKVFIGSSDGKLYALNATTGAVIWNYQTGGIVFSSPAVADGRVYVGSYDGKVYAFGSTVHDVAVTNVTFSRTVVGQGFSVSINATVENKGGYEENFNVTAYANTTSIASQNFTLSSGNSASVTFEFNTTGFAKGNYTISAYAGLVPEETNTADNTRVGGHVLVAMVGDISGPAGVPDGKVDIRDIALVALYFGQNVPPAPANCDITGPIIGVPDNKVDIRDIATVAIRFGQIDP